MSTKPQQSDEFEELYLKERKKSSMLLIAVVALAILAAGSLIWAISKDSSTSQLPENAPSQGFGGRGQAGGGSPGMDITNFFKDDGSVDTEQIDELTNRFPSGAGSQFTDMIKERADQAVEDGDITQEQADELIEKIETATESSDAN